MRKGVGDRLFKQHSDVLTDKERKLIKDAVKRYANKKRNAKRTN